MTEKFEFIDAERAAATEVAQLPIVARMCAVQAALSDRCHVLGGRNLTTNLLREQVQQQNRLQHFHNRMWPIKMVQSVCLQRKHIGLMKQ